MKRKFTLKTVAVLLAAAAALIISFGSVRALAAGSADVLRFGGETRLETSGQIADHYADISGGVKTVFIANGFSFPDALAGIPLADSFDAPILLTGGSSLESSVAEELKRLHPDKVFILGGTGVISVAEENEIASLGISFERLCGATRYDTAAKIARRMLENDAATVSGSDKPATIYVVSGAAFPDALSVSPVAAIQDSPIIYADPSGRIPDSEMSVLSDFDIRSAVIIGGSAAVKPSVEVQLRDSGFRDIVRISGDTRYDTSAEIYSRFRSLFSPSRMSIASGENFPDALSGGVLSGKLSLPLVLVKNNAPNQKAADIFRGLAEMRSVVVYGGTGAINDYTVRVITGEAVYTTTTTTRTTTRPTTTTTAAVAQPTRIDGKRSNHVDVKSPNYSSPYYIIVYTKNNTVRVLGKGADGGYNREICNFLCSTAKKGKTTPAGLYSISKRYNWRLMFGDVYAQYAVRFYGNYLFHSVPYKKQSPSTLEMDQYEKLGSPASLGCVRLCVRDAKWIYDNCPNGTQVRVIAGKDGPSHSSARSIPKLNYSKTYYGWDPTDPNPKNPYNK